MPFDSISYQLAKKATARSVINYDRDGDGFVEYIALRRYESLPAIGAHYELAIDCSDGYVKVFDPVTNSWKQITSKFSKGYTGFDNSGGGAWTNYVNIPITTIPSEYAQYKVVIDSSNVTVYSADGTQKTQGDVAPDFWANVKSDGSDIRVFDQAKSQLYFWIEEWDYSGQNATIWVNLTAGSSELNVAYRNPIATKSSYNDHTKVFELFRYDPFDTIDTSFWTHRESIVQASNDTYVSPSTSLKLYYGTEKPWHADCAGSLPSRTFWIMEFWWRNSGSDPSTVSDPDRGEGNLLTGGAHGTAVIGVTVYLDKINYGDNVAESGSFKNVWLHFRLVYDNGEHFIYREINGQWVLKKHIVKDPVQIDTVKFSISGYDHAEYADDLYLYTVKLADPADFGTPQVLIF